MNVVVVVVTYYPDKILLENNIQAFLDYVDKVLIWENTPEYERAKYRFVKHEKIEYVGDDVNSISHGLNYAWKYAADNGYDYLLTMDQDSVFMDFDIYLETTLKYNEQKICLIGPGISIGESSTLEPNLFVVDDKNHLITSGMLVPVSLLNKIGGYCEDFKIEAVDLDLCIRARAAGYSICRNTYGNLKQTFGNPYIRKLFGKSYIGSNYSSDRLYGIFRNHMILYRRYKSTLAKSLLKDYFFYFTPRILLWENNKYGKMKAIFCGLIDGIKFREI